MVFLILCVLLFGASAVWGVIKWGCLMPVLLLVIICVLVAVGVPFNEYMRQATRPARIERPVEVKKPATGAACQYLDGKLYDWCMKQRQGK